MEDQELRNNFLQGLKLSGEARYLITSLNFKQANAKFKEAEMSFRKALERK
jgi:hypothetical protein